MIILDKYIYDKPLNNYKLAQKNILENIKNVVNMFFSDKKMFTGNDIKFYYYDEYVLKTNTCDNTALTVYVEINQPKNIKNQMFEKKKSLLKKDVLIKDLHLTLREIKDGLFELFRISFAQNLTLWQDKYAINLESTEYNKGMEQVFNIRIIPCFTHLNEQNNAGVIYYDNNEKLIEIDYPQLAIKNVAEKDKLTNGLYKKYIIMIKNIFMEQKGVKNLPYEIFETILYNVPNELYQTLSTDNLVKIINYLRNFNMRDYKTLDEQDSAFTSKYKSFSTVYVKHVISQVEKFVKNNM